MVELEYIDKRPIFLPVLKYYGGNVYLPRKDSNIIKVTEDEARSLLKQKNGKNPVWKKVKKKKEDEGWDVEKKDLKDLKNKEVE